MGQKPTTKESFYNNIRVDSETGCWIWQGTIAENGYGHVRFQNKQWVAHRLSWIFYFGSIPDGLWVLHRCDVRACVNPKHLFLGNVLDNHHDMDSKGRRRFHVGEECYNTKLSIDTIREIRRLWATGNYRQRDLCKQFGISRKHIHKIVNGLIWKNV